MNVPCNTVVVLLGIASVTLGQDTEQDTWHAWKIHHRKVYSSESEAAIRKQTWLKNVHRISHHNSRNATFTLNLNQFSDLVSSKHSPQAHLETPHIIIQSEGEFSTSLLSPLTVSTTTNSAKLHSNSKQSSYPTSMDWRERGFVTEVDIYHHTTSL